MASASSLFLLPVGNFFCNYPDKGSGGVIYRDSERGREEWSERATSKALKVKASFRVIWRKIVATALSLPLPPPPLPDGNVGVAIRIYDATRTMPTAAAFVLSTSDVSVASLSIVLRAVHKCLSPCQHFGPIY